MRLTAGDLKVLGTFLFGPRWQCALARAIGCSDRQVRRWVAGECLVSVRASRLIEELVRSRHGEQMRRLRAGYLNMIAGLTDTGIRGRLLAMDLAELRVDDQIRQAGLSEQLSASDISPRGVPRPKIAGSRGDFGDPDGKMA